MPLPPPAVDLAVFDNPQLIRSDTGNAELLVEAFGRCCVRWTKGAGWFWFNGKHWERDSLDRVVECAKITMRWLRDNGPNADWQGWGASSQSSARISSMVKLAQSHPEVATNIDKFDDQPWLVCVQNGVIDLRTVTVNPETGLLEAELLPHDPAFLITKISPVHFDPELGTAGLFQKVLNDSLPEAEVQEYLLRLYGYGMTGTAVEHTLPLLWGGGQNGKTLTQEYVAWIYGTYAVAANEDLLIEQNNSGHPTEIARLFGARLVYCSETGENAKLNEKRVKKITGGNTQTGRFMNKDFFDFEPSWLVTMDTNYKPKIVGSDDGIWRRVSVIPYLVRIRDEDKDEHLPEKMRTAEEGSKALNLILKGLVQWTEDGLDPPKAVQLASDLYRSEMDDVGRFVKECCETGVPLDRSSPSVNIFEAYGVWSATENLTPMSSTMFGKKLTSLGYTNHRHKSGPMRDVTVRDGLHLLVTVATSPQSDWEPKKSTPGQNGWHHDSAKAGWIKDN